MEHIHHTPPMWENPPDYESDEAPPSYESNVNADRDVRYKLKQFDRGHQKFVPLSESQPAASLAIMTRTKPRLFTNRPDIQVEVEGLIIGPLPRNLQTVSIRFNDGAPTLPWFPKITMKVAGVDGVLQETLDMESSDFVYWKMVLDGINHYWFFQKRSDSLISKNILTRDEVAKWIYSGFGTDANHGDSCGELVISSNCRESRRLLIACSCYVVIVYWRRLGRHYRNNRMAGW